jgi:hypothetical protein
LLRIEQEGKMPTWKHLTDINGNKIVVNLDWVMKVQRLKNHTTLHFACSLAQGGVFTWNVQELPHDMVNQ